MKAFAFGVLCTVATAGTAFAEDPWEAGVPAERQKQANALFAEGNQLFGQQAHAPALEKYKAAIELWDHPMIRFNMAVTLIRLDRVLEAADQLESALRFDQAPFTPEKYQQAQDYLKLVSGRVGYVEASCEQKNVQILLDGKPWFACPGTQKRRVMSGEHAIVGEAKEFMTTSRRVVVAGGGTSSEKISLLPIDSVVKLEYPTPRWIPYTVAGIGAAVGVGGLAFWFAGKSQMDDFEADFAIACPMGCMADLSDQPLLADSRDSARLKGTIGITMMVTGGAIAIGGAVWAMVFNRPRRILPNMEVAPTDGGMAASTSWRF